MHVLSIVAKKKDLIPAHELGDEDAPHHLLSAMRERGGKPKLREARKIRPSGQVACERVRVLIYDLAVLDDYESEETGEFTFGWIAHARDALGISYPTIWGIARGEITSISTHTVDKISRKSGVPVSVFYDSEI